MKGIYKCWELHAGACGQLVVEKQQEAGKKGCSQESKDIEEIGKLGSADNSDKRRSIWNLFGTVS